MEKIIIISLTITFIFGIVKFAEMKLVNTKIKPLKHFIRDTAMVFVSSIIGCFIYFHYDGSISELFNLVTNKSTINNLTSPQIFTDAPGF